jgi:mRNA interferase RelE/StbE
MIIRRTTHFDRCYSKAPKDIQTAFDKQVGLLLHNLRHPSLRAKKFNESAGIWQARVTRDWRFYFVIEGDTYYLVNLTAHPK